MKRGSLESSENNSNISSPDEADHLPDKVMNDDEAAALLTSLCTGNNVQQSADESMNELDIDHAPGVTGNAMARRDCTTHSTDMS